MGSLARAMGGVRSVRRARPIAPLINPLQVHELVHGKGEEMPDPIEFVVSDKYLDRPNLYPRQGTILKAIFLRDDLFTQYDHDVIGEWEETFARNGDEGVSPHLLDRIALNKAAGRPWFREVLAVIGRRGSKGYTGALAGSYVLWNYMHKPGGPQSYYGIDRDKRLTCIVFAGKKEQAVANQWRDLTNVILGGPCFAPYISRPQAERLTVFAPADMLRAQRQQMLGIQNDTDPASFEIVPSPSTMMAGRGPASFMQFYDEMAHVVATGANRAAEDVYTAATPSLDQFGQDAFLYEPSSPWQMQGQFFANWEKSISLEVDGTPSFPEMLMFQLPSWAPYEDWDQAERIPLKPPAKTYIEVEVQVPGPAGEIVETRTETVERLIAGQTFQSLKRAIQSYDEQMKQLEKANPETFAVERRSRWAQSMSSYLNRQKVQEIFEPWGNRTLFVQTSGALSTTYLAHGDPATSNKRFGWSLGHTEWDEHRQMHHVVIDLIRCWEPADFPDHLLDYDVVMSTIKEDVRLFVPENVSFDQFNVPATIGPLRKYVAAAGLPKMVTVDEVSRTRPLNWRHFELFKSAVNMGLVHAPMLTADGEVNYASEQGELELRFLEEKNGAVDHPTSGPVQSKDIADTICEVTVGLIGAQVAAFLGQDLSGVSVGGALRGGTNPAAGQGPQAQDPAAALGALMAGHSSPSRGMATGARGMRRR
jgi:hypothetical protein